jgi:hypothetical protein
MNSQEAIQMLVYVVGITVVIILIASIMTDTPIAFRSRPLRFVYRSGLILYSRSFKVNTQSEERSIPRWQIEHWMTASGFSYPMAEEDGERQYILMEFFGFLFSQYPFPMRAKVSWSSKEKNITIRGYATWTYLIAFLIALAILIIPLVISTSESLFENACFSIPLLVYLFWSAFNYSNQVQRLDSIGSKIVAHLSAEE